MAVWLQYRNENTKEVERFERAVARVKLALDGKTRQVGSILEAMCTFSGLDPSGDLAGWPKLAVSLRTVAQQGGVVWTGFLERKPGGPLEVTTVGLNQKEPAPMLSAWEPLVGQRHRPDQEVQGLVSPRRVGVVHSVPSPPGRQRWAAIEVSVAEFLAGLAQDSISDPAALLRVAASAEWNGARTIVYSSEGENPAPRFRRVLPYAMSQGTAEFELSATPAFDRLRDAGGIWLTLAIGLIASLLIGSAVHIATTRTETDQFRIRTAVDSLGSAVCIGDQAGGCVYANPAFLRMFGEPDPTFPLAAVLDDATRQAVRAAISGQQGWVREIRSRTLDGRSHDLLLWIHPVRKDERVLGWIAELTDISERKQIEQAIVAARDAAIEASRMKSAFLANLSHEIRTPLNGVTGMLKLLDMTSLDAEQREYVSLAEGSAESLMSVINDILDFSKIEAGKVDLELTDFDLHQMLHQVVRVMGLPAKSKGTRVTAEIAPGMPPSFHGDPNRLRQVVLNLMSNAVKFTQDGAVTLRTSLTGGRLRVEVIDTGIGIPADVVPRLFAPFMQADQSMSRRFGGTGLGLAISRQLVELMGGEIGVESQPGKGSTFWFEIPKTADARPERTAFATAS